MEEFFALGKDEAPENIPMMFITMPSAKDPEAKIRHPGANQRHGPAPAAAHKYEANTCSYTALINYNNWICTFV